MRTPTYAYQIDYFTVTRDGNLEFDDRADSEEIEGLIEFLAERGFIAEVAATSATEPPETDTEKVPLPPTAPNTANLWGLRWKFRLRVLRWITLPSCSKPKADLSAEP